MDNDGILSRTDATAPLEFIGYRAEVMKQLGTVVAFLRLPSGRSHATTLIVMDGDQKKHLDALLLLAEAIAHAANTGVPAEYLQEVLSEFSNLVAATKFELLANANDVRLAVKRPAAADYVLDFGDAAVVVTPDIASRVCDPAELEDVLGDANPTRSVDEW